MVEQSDGWGDNVWCQTQDNWYSLVPESKELGREGTPTPGLISKWPQQHRRRQVVVPSADPDKRVRSSAAGVASVTERTNHANHTIGEPMGSECNLGRWEVYTAGGRNRTEPA